jgi:hypothetical protein
VARQGCRVLLYHYRDIVKAGRTQNKKNNQEKLMVKKINHRNYKMVQQKSKGKTYEKMSKEQFRRGEVRRKIEDLIEAKQLKESAL